MSDQSAIEWTDATWNPVRGCIKVSPGCANCYAETFAERFRGVPGHPYEQGFDLRLVPGKLDEPLTWKKPRRVFVNSMSDLFQDDVPDEYIDQVFAVMALAPRHTFQVLTKRAVRMQQYLSTANRRELVKGAVEDMKPSGPPRHWYHVSDASMTTATWPLRNVWLGVSVENQHFADERIPLLLQTPAAVRFISAEPLLGPIDLDAVPLRHLTPVNGAPDPMGALPKWQMYPMRAKLSNGLDWVIVGGESGRGARPFDVRWARGILARCEAADVPCFVKQLGANVTTSWQSGFPMRDPKGGDMAEWPPDLRVREFPEAHR